VACLGLFMVMSVVGVASLYTFRSRFVQQPTDPVGAQAVEESHGPASESR
jgi:hypothetical protein